MKSLVSLVFVGLAAELLLPFIIGQEIRDCLHDCDGKPIGYKIADANDGASYFLCHGEMIIKQHCEPGTKFVKERQTCVTGTCPPCNCVDNTTTMSTTSPTSPTSPTLTTSPTPPSTSCGANSPPPDCSTVPNGHLFPDAIHCRFFWQCVSGNAVCRFCEKGMWYDREKFVCNYPSAVHNCPAARD